MKRRLETRAAALSLKWLLAFSLLIAFDAGAQSAWRPEKQVEIILPTAAGGANDNVARLIQKILQDHKISPTPTLVMNKAGGNQTLAAVYLRQHPKDPHYYSDTLITKHYNTHGPIPSKELGACGKPN